MSPKQLKEKRHRETKQRQVILEVLRHLYTHPTPTELHQAVQKELPSIGLATVYRNLDFLEEEGRVIKLKSRDKEARYDAITEHHCHLICDRCKAIEDIFDVSGLELRSKQLRKTGFKLNSDYLELHGFCRKCQ
jgi:Fe2+ or Zn2+ uptake regulation protein